MQMGLGYGSVLGQDSHPPSLFPGILRVDCLTKPRLSVTVI